jgi:HK97 family phage portal protein
MSFSWGRIGQFFGIEKRDATGDAYLGAIYDGRGRGTASPEGVVSALGVAYACVSRRAQGLASVPLVVHRNIGPSNAERAEEHPLFDVLNSRPNEYQSSNEFRDYLVRCHDLYGNGYARIERNNRGQVVALHPFAPTMVAIERLPNGRLRYRATDFTGRVWVLLQEEMLHVRGPSRNNVYGLSPLHSARGTVGLAVAHTETAEALTENKLQPGGILVFPNNLTTEQRKQLRESTASLFARTENAGRLMILDGGAKYEHLSFSPHDAQFLESYKLSIEEIARIYDCPPTSVGITDKSTYSNTEQEALALVRNCLAPLAARIESALARCLLTDAGRRQYFLRHDFSELLRGDMNTRFQAYRLAREVGVYSPNDVRRLENEAPIPGGDQYHMPSNWVALGSDAAPGQSGGAP